MSINVVGDGSPIAVKGDILTHDGTYAAILSVGTNSQFLSIDATTPTGLKWVTESVAATSDWAAIAYTALTTDTQNITFDNISGSYRDLMLHCMWRSDNSSDLDVHIRLNNTTTSSYLRQSLENATFNTTFSGGAGYSATEITVGRCPGTSRAASHFGASVISIQSYPQTTGHKTILAQGGFNDNTAFRSGLYGGTLTSTSAITRIDFGLNSFATQKFATGSTFALYGLKGS